MSAMLWLDWMSFVVRKNWGQHSGPRVGEANVNLGLPTTYSQTGFYSGGLTTQWSVHLCYLL